MCGCCVVGRGGENLQAVGRGHHPVNMPLFCEGSWPTALSYVHGHAITVELRYTQDKLYFLI